MVSNGLITLQIKVGYRQKSEIINLKFARQLSKECVRKVLNDIDPQGVDERQREIMRRKVYKTDGPNSVYYIDGKHKLKN